MKRKSLFNKIIALSIIATLYLSMSASAYAELDIEEAPAAEQPVAEQTVDAETPEAPPAETADGQADSDATENTGQPAEEQNTDVPDADVVKIDEESVPEAISPETEVTEDDAKEAETDEESSGEKEETDEEDEDKDKDEKDECKHELIYTANKDGTHTVTCKDCDMESYTETCEYDESGKCIHCGWLRKSDPILTYEDEQVIVTVEGNIPENADLKVTPLTADNEATKDAYNQAASKLNEKAASVETDVIGFLAYDICFIDMDTGEEKEPDGDVKVSFSYKEAVNPASEEDIQNAEKINVEVLHINEETSELENLTESGDARVSTTGSELVKEASFTNDSFSTYMLTWNGQYNKKLNVKFAYKDGSKELTPDDDTNKEFTVDGNSQQVIIADEAATMKITGYRFVKATYKDGSTEKEVTSWKYRKSGSSYYLDLYKGTTRVTYISFASSKEIPITLNYVEDISLKVLKSATGEAATDNSTEYKFLLKNSSGAVNGATYKIGNASHTTENGEFILKTGEEAVFYSLEAGSYNITETGTTGDKYTLSNFTTEIFVDGASTASKTYDFDATDLRSYDVTVSGTDTTSIKFKNCLTTSEKTGFLKAVVQKYVRDNGDDKYDVQFKFGGPTETWVTKINEQEVHQETEVLPVDIILLVDKSTSMDDVAYAGGPTKMRCVKDAVTSMVAEMTGKMDVDPRWKVIDFAKSAKVITKNWITTSGVNNAVTMTLGKNESIGGGTNYDIGFQKVQSEFANSREGAKKIVIFLTDGYPTYYMVGNDLYNAFGKHDDYYNNTGLHFSHSIENATYASVRNLDCDYFYAVGMGLGMVPYEGTGETGGIQGYDLLTNICNNAALTYKPNPSDGSPRTSPVTQAYDIQPSQVGTILKDLAGTIKNITDGDIRILDPKTYYASNVTMTDTLSDYVEPLPGGKFKISVTRNLSDLSDGVSHESQIGSDGSVPNATYDLPDGQTLTATYKDKKIELKFPEGYVLDDGYEFVIRIDVKPSVKAYDEWYANKDAENPYPHIGDPETDHINNDPNTSSYRPGFYSNGVANTTYTFQGKSYTDDFPKPVVQVHFKNEWEIFKVNKDGVKLNGAQFSLNEKDTGTATYTGESQMVNSSDGFVKWDKTVATGKTYQLTETKAPDSYIKSDEQWTITLSSENVPTVKKFANAEDTQGQAYTVEGVRVPGTNIIKYTFNFVNETSYSLPQTGGNGTRGMMALGVLMIITSGILFYRNRKSKSFLNTMVQ